MPITVACPACSSRFSLSDDLYRRRVAGSLVKVKCRNCQAEIAVDATEPDTEAPRKHPLPPRPKAITQLGLGTPPAPTELATSSPLPLNLSRTRPLSSAAVTPLPLNGTVTPLPLNAASVTSHSAGATDSIWDDEETIAINAATVKAPPRAPIAKLTPSSSEEDLELIEAEEVPVSSSGVPTLDALTSEAGGAHVPHGKPPPDEFLVSLSAGGDGAQGAPTIDVTSFAAEIPASVDVALSSQEEELEYRPARAGTVPLFDMSAVLPAASESAGSGSAASAAAKPGKAAAEPRAAEGRARERKYVIAPESSEATSDEPKPRRSKALLWAGLLAAAAAVALVGSRERWLQSASNEPAPVPTPVVNTQASLPAEAPAPAEGSEAAKASAAAESSETATATPSASAIATAKPATPTVQNVTASTTHDAEPTTVAALKSGTSTPRSEAAKPSSDPEPAVEKPAVVAKAIEARNAPPPAPPDTEFDRAAARNALASAATQASSCRKEGDPSGTANLTITFAPSGRVTSAQIQGPPFSGTPTGGCIASTMRRASVPAFSGDYVTVSKTIVVQ